jgi:hypothetical protein
MHNRNATNAASAAPNSRYLKATATACAVFQSTHVAHHSTKYWRCMHCNIKYSILSGNILTTGIKCWKKTKTSKDKVNNLVKERMPQ